MDEAVVHGAASAAAGSGEEAAAGSNKLMLDMRKYILLLAILAATVTYVAGLNPPGGVWVDSQGGHLIGNQILVVTYHTRYNAFSYSNATAFMASGVVILLLLLSMWANLSGGPLFVALRWVMVLDMLALLVAYAAAASRDTLTTALASVLVSLIFFYVLLHMLSDSFLSKSLGLWCSSGSEREPPIQLGGEPEACCSSCVGRYYPAAASTSCDSDECCKQQVKRRRKTLMLLAIFAATITYTAGLNPPGGFWPDTQDEHRAGDPVLENRHHGRRFIAFFVGNTASFVASLAVIMLLLTNRFYRRFLNQHIAEATPPYLCLLTSLLGLVGAYAFGSCRETESTAGVLVLYVVGLALVIIYFAWLCFISAGNRGAINSSGESNDQGSVGLVGGGPGEARSKAVNAPETEGTCPVTPNGILKVQVGRTLGSASDGVPVLVRFRSVVQLLAILGVTVTYAAGLNPPGGFWPDDRDGHKGGDPILLTMNATRYRVFLYCNSTALAASMVVVFMVHRNFLSTDGSLTDRRRQAVWAALSVDMTSLIAAYAAGCCRDLKTSIYVMALAGAAVFYIVLHMAGILPPSGGGDDDSSVRRRHTDTGRDPVEEKRKLLLELAVLAATLTYQAGLTPPGGFWLEGDESLGHRAGDPVLLSNYPRRYKVFFYLNATSFMASVALTIILLNPRLYRHGIRCHALCVCMVAGLLCLMGAYAAGSSRHVRTTVFMVTLIALVLIFIILLLLVFWIRPDWIKAGSREGGGRGSISPRGSSEAAAGRRYGDIEPHTGKKYLILLGILAASVTYQAGLVPPGGVWPDNRDEHTVGDPILRDSNSRRYLVFFLCNSTSFVASVVIITLLLLVELIPNKQAEDHKFQAAHGMMIVDLLGLLGAYAAGSCREWETFGYILALVSAVPFYIVLQLAVCPRRRPETLPAAWGSFNNMTTLPVMYE